MTQEQLKLVLETKIKERSQIIYIIESDIADNHYRGNYRLALKDEIENHKLAIKEYQEELKKL